ncbi:MAG: DUF371 domain-containing protein [Methanoculleaceae archaeon]
MMEVSTWIRCCGHPAITATHRSTFEVTRDPDMSPAGDCIIGVAADRGAADLPERFRRLLCNDIAILVTRLHIGGCVVEIHGRGSSRMTLTHPTDLVWRRSGYICDRTVSIFTDHTARTLPRPLIAALREGERMDVELSVSLPGEFCDP